MSTSATSAPVTAMSTSATTALVTEELGSASEKDDRDTQAPTTNEDAPGPGDIEPQLAGTGRPVRSRNEADVFQPMPEVRCATVWIESDGMYWYDMTQIFASALEAQRKRGERVARFIYRENLRVGGIEYLHDIEQGVQINTRTGVWKSIRRVDLTPLVLPAPLRSTAAHTG